MKNFRSLFIRAAGLFRLTRDEASALGLVLLLAFLGLVVRQVRSIPTERQDSAAVTRQPDRPQTTLSRAHLGGTLVRPESE